MLIFTMGTNVGHIVSQPTLISQLKINVDQIKVFFLSESKVIGYFMLWHFSSYN